MAKTLIGTATTDANGVATITYTETVRIITNL